jgi:Zn-dependent peptidase ImmA (M78 family)/DNA-binding XRE family transcriptional regulator
MDIGSRIQQARKMRGLSLRDLGEQASLSAQAISKYERGLDVPGSGSLLRLSRALEVPVEFFVRPGRVVEIRPEYRKRSSLPQKDQESLKARILDWLDRYLEAEEIRGLSGFEFKFPAGFPRDIASPAEIERAALDLRDAWKLGWDPIENLTELLEDHDIRVGVFMAEPRFDACTFAADVDGKTLPVIASRRGVPGDRQRFSLAHELGHLMIRASGGLDAEAAMNRFAGAFLVPEPAARFELGGVRRSLEIHELHLLKHKYGLSMQGWIYRAKDLGLLSESRAASLFRDFRVQGWHRQEPGDALPAERPSRFERLVLQAWAEDLLSETRAAELLGKPLRQFLSEISEEHDGLPGTLRNGYERLD